MGSTRLRQGPKSGISWRSTLLGLVLGVALLAAAPSVAGAAVSVDGGVLKYDARTGDTNDVTISFNGTDYAVSDVVPVDVSTGCIATGPNAGRRAHRPTDRRVEEGDFLSVCLGAAYRGYRCEIGRTFVIGTSPADWQIELYDLVFAAQRAGREALAPGVACRDVDRAARQILDSAGYTEGLPVLTGHGVGLEIEEDPQLTPAAMGKLDACVPVTVEPGVHLPGRGGVRIDDTLVVRPEADGGPELLTITTKELLAL